MEVQCFLSQIKGNPQIPVNSGDAIRVIIEFKVPENFNGFISKARGNAMHIKVGDKAYQCVAYEPTDNSRAIRIFLGDGQDSDSFVTMLLDVYADLADIKEFKTREFYTLIL